MESVNDNNASICIRGLDQYISDEELNSVDLFKNYPNYLMWLAIGSHIIFMIIGIPGNLITILALANYRKVMNATAIFIINLSLSDLLLSCVIIPIKIIVFWTRHWIGGKVMCMAYPILNYGTRGASVFNIVAITVNRYVMVSHPSIYPKMYQIRNLMIMIFCIWLGAFTMMIPVLTELWGRISLDPVIGFCTVVKGKNGSSPKILYVILGFVFPFTCIIVCYSRIIWIVRKSTKKMDNKTNKVTQYDSTGPIKQDNISNPELSSFEMSNVEDSEAPGLWYKNTFRTTVKRAERPNKPTRRDKKLQTMTVATVITFFVCHLPILIANIVNIHLNNPYGIIIGYIMLNLTTCSNPVIYVVLSSEYRQAYKHLFKKVLGITL